MEKEKREGVDPCCRAAQQPLQQLPSWPARKRQSPETKGTGRGRGLGRRPVGEVRWHCHCRAETRRARGEREGGGGGGLASSAAGPWGGLAFFHATHVTGRAGCDRKGCAPHRTEREGRRKEARPIVLTTTKHGALSPPHPSMRRLEGRGALVEALRCALLWPHREPCTTGHSAKPRSFCEEATDQGSGAVQALYVSLASPQAGTGQNCPAPRPANRESANRDH